MILVLLLLALSAAPDRPNPATTPGATNPAITQANLHQNICKKGWSTTSIRPPASYTTALKREQLKNWGLAGQLADFEEDHLISLELGGAPRNPDNLWPEPYAGVWGAKRKDTLENRLHQLVCAGTLTLAVAQHAIARDWIAAYQRYVTPSKESAR